MTIWVTLISLTSDTENPARPHLTPTINDLSVTGMVIINKTYDVIEVWEY